MARKNLTHEIIVAATLKLIDEKGSISNLNLREIARTLGCAHTSIYHFFPSYGDLMLEVGRTIMMDMRKVLIQHSKVYVSDSTYENPVIAYIACVVEYALNHRGWYRFLWMDNFEVDLNVLFKDQPRPETLLLHIYLEAYDLGLSEAEAMMRLNIGHGYVHGELCKFLSQRNQETQATLFLERILTHIRWLLNTRA